MANILTGTRIFCSLLLLPFPVFSGWYYIFYLIAGFTDAIDGAVARRLGTSSDFGAKFDTAADFIFALSVAVKLIRTLRFPIWLQLWIGCIILFKATNIVVGAVKYRRFVAVHSVLNKVCGIIVFVFPLLFGGALSWRAKTILSIFVCTLATVAALHEGHLIRSGNVEVQ